ncbi:MAG: RNA polymerase sigma factor region1.1 domain-containing protein, partial [Alphaproteobacteria bacterium]
MARNEAQEETTEERDDTPDGPLMDGSVQGVKKMIARGKERGFITYDELNETLPQDQVSSEQIEDVLAQLSEMGINVVEEEEKDDTNAKAAGDGGKAAAPAPEETKEVAPAPATKTRATGAEDLGRTDDPVRMYLREMGSVELLSREGEIAIAKRIEAGREKMIGAICESPLTIRAIIAWRDALEKEQILLRDVIDLDATHSGGPGEDNSANGG